MNISIIVPCYNESKNIKDLISKIKNIISNCKIVIVDDSFNDHTLREVENLENVHCILRGKKMGRGSAVLEGIDFSIKNYDSELFVEMDADLSHDPSELTENIKSFQNFKCDLLISSRYLKKSKIKNWSITRRIFSLLANFLAKLLLKIPVTDYTNGYRIYSKSAANHIVKKCGKIGDGFIILSEILVELHFNNFKINEVSTIFINRIRGESSVNFNEIYKSFVGLFKVLKLKLSIIKKLR